MVLKIAVRDFGNSQAKAEAWLASVGIVGALSQIAQYWWVNKGDTQDLEAPEAKEVRKQLTRLATVGCLDLSPE